MYVIDLPTYQCQTVQVHRCIYMHVHIHYIYIYMCIYITYRIRSYTYVEYVPMELLHIFSSLLYIINCTVLYRCIMMRLYTDSVEINIKGINDHDPANLQSNSTRHTSTWHGQPSVPCCMGIAGGHTSNDHRAPPTVRTYSM